MKGQFTIRLYDSRIVNEIESVFKKLAQEGEVTNKNNFLAECVMRGFKEICNERSAKQNFTSLNQLGDLINSKLTHIENSLVNLVEKKSREQLLNIELTQQILASNNRMLMGIGEDNPLLSKLVNTGMYDDLPERFSERKKAIKVLINE